MNFEQINKAILNQIYQKIYSQYLIIQLNKNENRNKNFYMKEKTLSEVTARVKMGFHNFQKHQKLLKPKSIENFLRIAQQSKTVQRQEINNDSDAIMDALFDVVRCLNSDRELMEFVLPTIDAILMEERRVLREVIERTRKEKGVTIAPFKIILSLEGHADATYESAARIISLVLGELDKELFFNEQRAFMLQMLQSRKRETKRQKISDFGIVSCFIHLNKHSELARVFLQNDGSQVIIDCLTKSSNDIQKIYYALLNVWMLSFIEQGIERFISVPKFGVLKTMCEILQKISREKITRISFMIFKNIQTNHACLQLMIDNKLLKIIDTLLKGNIKDQQLIDDIKAIGTVLQNNIKVLSSFDKYCKEVNSELLEWSSVHTERFWSQNKSNFEINDYHMIKKLKSLLDSKRALNVAIACYDLGEFCRFYPNGKKIIQSYHIKDLIMEKARYSDDKQVREQALLALQKIMIQNWQNL